MTVEEAIKKLKRFKPDAELCLMDTRCIEQWPFAVSEIRRASKKEVSRQIDFMGDDIVILQ